MPRVLKREPNGRDARQAAARIGGVRSGRLLIVLSAVLLALVTPASAQAHAILRSSDPAFGARLDTVPREIRLTFSEPPELAVSTIELLGPDGRAMLLGPIAYATESHRAIVAQIRGALVAGRYTIVWRVTGDDGHPTHGVISFEISSGAAGLPLVDAAPSTARAPVASTPPTAQSASAVTRFDASSPAYVAVRALLYVGLLVVLGAVAFRFLVLGRLSIAEQLLLQPRAARAAATWGARATCVVLVSAVLRLAAQSYAVHGRDGLTSRPMLGTMLGHTAWGWGWLLQVAGAIVAGAAFVLASRAGDSSTESAAALPTAREHPAAWSAAALGAALLAFTPALASHAMSAPRLESLAILADGLHVMGAGGWLGSLLVLLLVGLPSALTLGADERGSAAAALVESFSPMALGCAAVIALTGGFAAWIHVASVHALWRTRYGMTLLAKLVVLAGVVATGAYNFLRVRPALGNDAGTARLRRSTLVELAIGLAVLIITAVLVATPTPADLAGITR
jgi:putative copper export protein/methionine-rich copper-binding protein CopC